ncbi:hypothetical protein TanjilG_09510 [Lupinus angustifolius]|uniref:DNA mismatch repair proteins mutS family domain-containing protein n=1 Tax=Lupinus angustifolius TaxID=3871 RepID=A0A4P1RWV4_LUPAN|nr:hypothetical protein TanjilG_09510 [Lupinus angustifolius]
MNGLYVLASESVQIPWFDSVFADIGDEQSLSQSLSTFSGHLKQIGHFQNIYTSIHHRDPMKLSDLYTFQFRLISILNVDYFLNIKLNSTSQSILMVLRVRNCQVGAGRSNAINIAERLGLTSVVVDGARKLYGSASAEIDEVITDMEKLKQDYQELLDEGHHHLMLSRELYNSLLSTRRKIMKHSSNLRYKKMRDVSEAAAMARSILHKKVRQLDASPKKPSQPNKTIKSSQSSATNNRHTAADSKEPTTIADGSASAVKKVNQLSPDRSKLPKVGDMVNVTSLGRKAAVLKVDSSKGEIVVQAGSMKLKLKVTDIQIS